MRPRGERISVGIAPWGFLSAFNSFGPQRALPKYLLNEPFSMSCFSQRHQGSNLVTIEVLLPTRYAAMGKLSNFLESLILHL